MYLLKIPNILEYRLTIFVFVTWDTNCINYNILPLFSKRAEFQCAVVDCPEYENEDSRCYYKYELGYCCATQKICRKLFQLSTDNLKLKYTRILAPFSGITCKVGSNIYREGEQFFASDSCTECVCQKGFSGKFVEPFCRRIDCPIQLNSVEVIAKRCAPVYIAKPNEPLCCPTTFLCRNRKSFFVVQI